ncbi:hypothetical protein Salbus254_3895 [Streptomyces albidoflavus]|nr:hypothetical protein Salbus254_3895 [Streptomyces albidoflavus]
MARESAAPSIWAVTGPCEGDQRQSPTTENDHGGAAVGRAPMVCLPSYTQVSSHIRERQPSIGIGVPV